MSGDPAGCWADGSLTDKPGDNVVGFPVQLRIVRVEQDVMVPLPSLPVLVEHDGRVYPLAVLLQHLAPHELQKIGDTVPRSGQAMWDEVVRRWPALAAGIILDVQPAGDEPVG